VESFGDAVFSGKVAYVSPSLDPTMRTFTVESLVDNADRRLKPGFFAKGVILTKKDEGVMAIPDSAVSTLAGVSSVYVVADGKITQQTVTLGIRQGNLWEVLDGLKGPETLAASRLNELATGVSVTEDTGEGDKGTGGAGRGNGGRRGGGGGGRGRRNGEGGQRGGA
jgi:multidrug efflux pump subunit AcrA (membrane-fusion protein)